ncbi:glycosyltransferase [Mesobacillus foraminis]|uniref:Glycosyltransferase involved in cell wall biosynthesis n=1 Tax=Mesobacillus foraminis TaxID=279826 RepID=A0A4R2B6J5_9BACI|nr:glycosyltransferase [Mesobacillus foraminis]TCN22196.1 glycosyltransferase involved in cell wall biosynthesis [Mesobacillus foraminis]
MKKKILIASFDMEVGGVERSLISLLENFDYEQYDIDLMLYRHQGDFMSLVPNSPNLLPELPLYSTFRKSIGEVIKEGYYMMGISRILAKVNTSLYQKINNLEEPGYYQMQAMWKYSLPILPRLNKEYDIAISYLWPHYFVADKVKAKKKIAWIHTDYSVVETDKKQDLKIWKKFDHIVAVSEACKSSFLKRYCELEHKTKVIENITSPVFIRKMSNENVDNIMQRDKRFKILTIARLSHAKGIDNAVKALKILIERGYKDVVWYIVGYGGDECQIKELITKYNLKDHFILLGKKINPYPYLKVCDLYVQPSRYEGKAVTVTEAKILGRPILITNYSTAHSQIEKGFDGDICDLSIDGIVAGIEHLYDSKDVRERFKENLRNLDFSSKVELINLYELLKLT